MEDVADSTVRKRPSRVPRVRGNDGHHTRNQNGRFTVNRQLKAPLQEDNHLLMRMIVFWMNAAGRDLPKRERHVGGMKHPGSKGRHHLPRRDDFELIKHSQRPNTKGCCRTIDPVYNAVHGDCWAAIQAGKPRDSDQLERREAPGRIVSSSGLGARQGGGMWVCPPLLHCCKES